MPAPYTDKKIPRPRTLVLHSYFRSSCAWRVRIALEFKGLKYSFKEVNIREDIPEGELISVVDLCYLHNSRHALGVFSEILCHGMIGKLPVFAEFRTIGKFVDDVRCEFQANSSTRMNSGRSIPYRKFQFCK